MTRKRPGAPKIEGGMKSLRMSLHVLSHFVGPHVDLGVAELSDRTGMPKGQISKILSAFRDSGFLRQDAATRRYSVGARAFALGSRFVNHDQLTREALPLMRDLCTRSGHSVRLSVRDGDEVLYLFGIEGPAFVDTGWRAGAYLPFHSTSAGRVILAFMEPDHAAEVIARIDMKALTPQTVTDRGELRQVLAQVRTQGYSTQRGETTPDLGTVGVPIFGPQQKVLGVLAFAFPVRHLLPKQERPMAELLHRAARVLSQRMGCQVYPFGAMPRADAPAPPVRAPGKLRVAAR
jgi:DNA-binding IclR family transcriptional regulator